LALTTITIAFQRTIAEILSSISALMLYSKRKKYIMSAQDLDPLETQEWLEAFKSVARIEGVPT
jgi:hypothetical protein